MDLTPRRRSALTSEGWNNTRVGHALRDGQLVRVMHGVYRAPGDLAPDAVHEQRARAVLLRRRTEAVLSHESAAILHGIPIRRVDPELVHLTATPPARVRRRAGYHQHVAPLGPADVATVRGLPVTSRGRTVFDLIRTVPYVWAVVACDWGLRAGIDKQVLSSLVESHPGFNGMEQARAVIAFADPRAQSPLESASRVTIARAGLPAPILQFEVLGEDGWVATGDFGWPELGVVGEADGRAKYGPLRRVGESAEDVLMREKARDEDIRRAGYWPTRWGWSTGFDVGALGAQLRKAFAQPVANRSVSEQWLRHHSRWVSETE